MPKLLDVTPRLIELTCRYCQFVTAWRSSEQVPGCARCGSSLSRQVVEAIQCQLPL